MNSISKFLFTLFLLFFSCIHASFQKEIVIIVPSYNNRDWYQRNLSSILLQEYSNFSVIYIDDCSPDGTGFLVEEFLRLHDHDHRVILIKNQERRGALANHWRAIQMVPEHAIVVHCDGDDWFAHKKVLERVNQEYQDPAVWMTYGQYVIYPSNERGHCIPTPQEFVNQNAWRKSLLMRWGHLRTFYAGLFKQIKLDDLLFKNNFFPLACDNAFMFPMLEMAQSHVRFIPDILYVYNQDTPLNDFKNHLDKQLAVARYIQQKQSYQPLECLPEPASTDKAVDLLVFSFNRPLQLYAFLESVERYIEGLSTITVLYRASSNDFQEGYEQVRQRFAQVNFVRQENDNPHANFKQHVLNSLEESPSPYILFGVDDVIVKDSVSLKECVGLMEDTHANGFFLRMGKNITNHYLADVSLTHDTNVPLYNEILSGVCAWQFRNGKHEWAYPNTVDMTIYRKKDIKPVLVSLSFTTPNTLEGQWYGSSDFTNVGLCFAESKIVNLPLNVVQEEKHNNMLLNRTTYNLDVHDLLNKFNQGLKIDIEPLHSMENSAPHMDYLPNFIKR